MARYIKTSSQKAGLPPGSIVPVGQNAGEETVIDFIDYNAEACNQKNNAALEDCLPLIQPGTVSWINVTGLSNAELIEQLGENFGLHPLVREDIANTGQRPKFEELDNLIFLVLKMLSHDPDTGMIMVEQVSLVLGDTFVLSFQEIKGDVFDPIRERIRNDKGRIRKMGADYLAYALCDAVVDQYFTILEQFSDTVESVEDKVVSDPEPKMLLTIQALKRDAVMLRKSIWPLREVIHNLERSENTLIQPDTRQYLRDVYDHTIRVIDTVEAFRDLVGGLLDIYMSSVSNKMNEVMKVLTIIATIFIPLTFIAGVYGMNFAYMPELQWRWSYFTVMGIMGGLFLVMIAYFKKKKWL